MVGVGIGQISNIESGTSAPSIEVFLLLAEKLECSLDWLGRGMEPSQVASGKSYERAVLDRQLDQLPEKGIKVLLATAKALADAP